MKKFDLYRNENFFIAVKNRLLQSMARSLPGHGTIRVWCHRLRGVNIGENVFIGTDVIIDTSIPKKIFIGNNVVIGMRCTLIGHFGNLGMSHIKSDRPALKIEDNVFMGPGVIILPNVTIGEGSVLTAGSVVFRSVPPRTMMQGNPAQAIGRCGIPLTRSTPMSEFNRKLIPIRPKKPVVKKETECKDSENTSDQ
jgi:acetyltransferase-like isoleucine patch superfamily enzyme